MSPPGQPVGVLWFTTEYRPDGERHVRILQADPRIMISTDLLDGIREGKDPGFHLVDDILTVDAINQRAVYRIGEEVPDCPAYYAEWPD